MEWWIEKIKKTQNLKDSQKIDINVKAFDKNSIFIQPIIVQQNVGKTKPGEQDTGRVGLRWQG